MHRAPTPLNTVFFDESMASRRRGVVADPPPLAALRRLALEIDRACAELHDDDADRAPFLWQSLVSGGFIVCDRFQSAGRTFLIARRQDARFDKRAITGRVRQVLVKRALGYPLKVIAHDLGIATSTASRELKRGLDALGMKCPSELPAAAAIGETPLAVPAALRSKSR
jgi:hypothetical protein